MSIEIDKNDFYFEEKCICELCECGYHRCSHVLNDNLCKNQNFKTNYYSIQNLDKNDVYSNLDEFSLKVDKNDLNLNHQNNFQTCSLEDINPICSIEELKKSLDVFSTVPTHKANHTQKNLTNKNSNNIKPILQNTFITKTYPPFDAISTHQADFNKKIVQPIKQIPCINSSFNKLNVPFHSTTTHKQDYCNFNVPLPPKLFKPQENNLNFSQEPFTATTEHRANFGQKFIQPAPIIREKMNIFIPSSTSIDFKSTYQEGYGNKNYNISKLSHDKFHNLNAKQNKINKKNYLMCCPAEMVLNKSDCSFKPLQIKNGHFIYQKILPPSVSNVMRYRKMSPIYR